jgi:tetraacyldisaccharide 4'-kinase
MRLKGVWLMPLSNIELALTQQHYAPQLQGWWRLLQPVSQVYAGVAHAVQLGYACGLLPQIRLPVPVISVGNLTAGGTGKTPFTIAIAQHLTRQGANVLVLNRGYRATLPFTPGQPLTAAHGDEAMMIQQAVPEATVWVGANRVALAQKALATQAVDVVLLDDGHQHRRLHKTLDLVLIDAHNGVGNGHCLPIGPLREPWPTHWPQNTHVVWVSKTQTTPNPLLGWPINRALPLATHQHTSAYATVWQHQGQRANAADTLQGQPVVVVTGVAHAKPLLQQLANLGAEVRHHWQRKDHATYTIEDWKKAGQLAAQHGALLVTTQKDWVKAPQAVLPLAPWVADLQADLPASLYAALATAMESRP